MSSWMRAAPVTVTAMVDTSSANPLPRRPLGPPRSNVTHLRHASGAAPPNKPRTRGLADVRAQTSTGASAGRLSMKELTEKTALPAPGGP
jgi:hypothetical protein